MSHLFISIMFVCECPVHIIQLFFSPVPHVYSHWRRKLLKVRGATLIDQSDFLLQKLHSYGEALNLMGAMAPLPAISAAYAVADLGGVPRVPWNPPFGFSDDRRLWKPGL